MKLDKEKIYIVVCFHLSYIKIPAFFSFEKKQGKKKNKKKPGELLMFADCAQGT